MSNNEHKKWNFNNWSVHFMNVERQENIIIAYSLQQFSLFKVAAFWQNLKQFIYSVKRFIFSLKGLLNPGVATINRIYLQMNQYFWFLV